LQAVLGRKPETRLLSVSNVKRETLFAVVENLEGRVCKMKKTRELDLKKQEINFLYGKISEIETTLKEEKKVNARWRSDVETKILQLSVVESKIATEKETFKWRKETITGETNAVADLGETRLRALTEKQNDITVEIAEVDVLQSENDRLHERVKVLASEHMIASQQQKVERETRKQKNFDTRMSMDSILRRVLKEVDEEYRLAAASRMGDEATNARVENVKLKASKAQREEDCVKLLKIQQTSYEEMMKTKLAKEVLATTASMQEESTSDMQRHNEELFEEMQRLSQSAASLREDIGTLERDLKQKEALLFTLAELTHKYQEVHGRNKAACKHAIGLCRGVLSEGILLVEREQKKKSASLSNGSLVHSANDTNDNNIACKEENADVTEVEAKQSVTSFDEQAIFQVPPLLERVPPPKLPRFSPSPSLNPTAVWCSASSDAHLSTALRIQKRKLPN